MKEINAPLMDDSWTFLGASLCVAKIDGDGWSIEYSQEVEEPWLGVVQLFTNSQEIICREFDFLDQGVFLKVWGFEENFKNNNASVALLNNGKWFLKEDGDTFLYDADFSKDRKSVTSFKVELSNNQKKIEIEIRPKT